MIHVKKKMLGNVWKRNDWRTKLPEGRRNYLMEEEILPDGRNKFANMLRLTKTESNKLLHIDLHYKNKEIITFRKISRKKHIMHCLKQ